MPHDQRNCSRLRLADKAYGDGLELEALDLFTEARQQLPRLLHISAAISLGALGESRQDTKCFVVVSFAKFDQAYSCA